MKTQEKRNALKDFIYEGSWRSYGAGETGCDLYIRGYWIGELSGDNGVNRFYNPSGEPWRESINDFINSLSDKRVNEIFKFTFMPVGDDDLND